MSAAKKQKYVYTGETPQQTKAKITVEVLSEDFAYIEEWLRAAPDCARDYDITITKIEAVEL